MRVYPSRNTLATEQFIRDVLKYCEGKPTFIIDNAPWLEQALEELGLPYNGNPFRDKKPDKIHLIIQAEDKSILQ
jgi:putative transposase